jgi:hypothetical protein
LLEDLKNLFDPRGPLDLSEEGIIADAKICRDSGTGPIECRQYRLARLRVSAKLNICSSSPKFDHFSKKKKGEQKKWTKYIDSI